MCLKYLWARNLTTQLHLMPRSRMVEPYLHSPTCLHGIVNLLFFLHWRCSKVKVGRAVAQAVSRWLPTAAARVRVRAACGVCGGQSGTGAGLFRVLRFPLPITPPLRVEGVAWSAQRIPTAVNLGFLDQSRYFFIQVASQLSSRGWMDPVPDPPLLRKSGRAGNGTRDLWICSQKL
jgi:hypothetical protein